MRRSSLPSRNVDKRLGNIYPVVDEVHGKLKELVFLANNLDSLAPRDIELGVDNGGNLLWRKVPKTNEDTTYPWVVLVNLQTLNNEHLLNKIDDLEDRLAILENQ